MGTPVQCPVVQFSEHLAPLAPHFTAGYSGFQALTRALTVLVAAVPRQINHTQTMMSLVSRHKLPTFVELSGCTVNSREAAHDGKPEFQLLQGP